MALTVIEQASIALEAVRLFHADKLPPAMRAELQRVSELLQERCIWRYRQQFPDNPYCVHCGAGFNWVERHGHEHGCPLAPQKQLAEADKQAEGRQ